MCENTFNKGEASMSKNYYVRAIMKKLPNTCESFLTLCA